MATGLCLLSGKVAGLRSRCPDYPRGSPQRMQLKASIGDRSYRALFTVHRQTDCLIMRTRATSGDGLSEHRFASANRGQVAFCGATAGPPILRGRLLRSIVP
jgi:hypothetical protein